MKAVILAGGRGTRLPEETEFRPKPMVEIGGRPILWHIMKLYAHYGVTEFILCLGYRGAQIKQYFANYDYQGSDLTIDLGQRTVTARSTSPEKWIVHLVDTGLDSQNRRQIRPRTRLGGG